MSRSSTASAAWPTAARRAVAAVVRPFGARPGPTRRAGRTDRPATCPAGRRLRYSRACTSAFIGFGLIAGSVARAVRANPATADWTMAAWSPTGTGPASALAEGIIDTGRTDARVGPRRHRHRRPCGARDRLPRAHRPAGRAVARSSAQDGRGDRRGQHEGRGSSNGPTPSGCASSAATRWPASSGPASAPRPPTCSATGPGSSCRARWRRRPIRARGGPRGCLLGPGDRDGRRRARPRGRRDQPPAARGRGRARRSGHRRTDADRRRSRPTGHRRRSGGGRLARHDPARPRRPGDGGGDRGHQRGGARRARPRPAGRPRCAGWPSSSASAARTRRRSTRRLETARAVLERDP